MNDANPTIDVQAEPTASPFVPIPGRASIRLLGPRPDQSAVAVDPLVPLDEAHGAMRAFLGGVCDRTGCLLQPLEFQLVADPANVVPHRQVPGGAFVRTWRSLPAMRARLVRRPGFEAFAALLADWSPVGPLIYCRKMHAVFEARAPHDAAPLHGVLADDAETAPEHPTAGGTLNDALVSSPSDGDPAADAARYGGAGGQCSAGEVRSLEQLILDQRGVVEHYDRLRDGDQEAARRLASVHRCCTCEERGRCYPADTSEYAYAADRLTVINAATGPLVVLPLGEWSLAEAARMIGACPPSEAVVSSEDNAFEQWRGARAKELVNAGPLWLLSGETSGRELLEVSRCKLTLFADVLTQLDAVWRETGRPHLCWNDDSIRVTWNRPGSTPATAWGFSAILRKQGWQPGAPFPALDETPMPYPPVYSDHALLAPEVEAAMRYFDQPRPAGLFVKRVKADADPPVRALLEEFNVAWELLRPADTIRVASEGFSGFFRPARDRDPNDGAGLPVESTVPGGLKSEQSIEGADVRWWPRFGEAVDLHAFGVLLLESLLGQEERFGASFREALAAERAELLEAMRTVPPEQRESGVLQWLQERAEVDAPAALWSRRNLLYRHQERSATRLDAFPPPLWEALLLYALRLITTLEGFSFCADRAAAAPRTEDGALIPLLELRGLIALLDDAILAREAPAAGIQAELE